MKMTILRPVVPVGLVVCSLLLLTACIDRELSKLDISREAEDSVAFPVALNSDLDILFVIDTSSSMSAEQTAVRNNFRRLTDQITSIEFGLPNLHIGVVSTDLGIGAQYADDIIGQESNCTASGDDGRLRAGTCLEPGSPFIVDIAAAGGGDARTRNYQGDLETAFSCIADLGTEGCGFEQPLQAMRLALDPAATLSGGGFLREHARLAIVFITDEDDCSVRDHEIFNPYDPGLGPWQSDFRCFEYGVTCDVDAPRRAGEHPDCQPRRNSPFVHDVADYVRFVRGLKRDPDRDILVAGIIGDNANPLWVDPLTIGGVDSLKVRKSCGDPDQRSDGAIPPVRLAAFLDAFAFRHQTTICDSALGDALAQLGEFMRPPLTYACMPETLSDDSGDQPGLQPQCEVAELHPIGSQAWQERALRACSNPTNPGASAQLPCYTLTPDPTRCGDRSHQLAIDAHYAAADTPPSGTVVVARCATQ